MPPATPDLAIEPRASHAGGIPCVFVSGPRGAGKTRWVQARIRELVAHDPKIRCGVILAEDGRTRLERFVHEVPGVAVRRVLLPCPCCPARAFLPDTIRQLITEPGADWLFVEAPATAAAGLLGEFDRDLGWPREVVVCLDEKWEWLRRRPDLPPFLSALLAQAGTIVSPSPVGAPPSGATVAAQPQLVLS